MSKFNLVKKSNLHRDLIFKISTDVENFHNVMPEYFKSLKIIQNSSNEKIVLESIDFLGRKIEIKTKRTAMTAKKEALPLRVLDDESMTV